MLSAQNIYVQYGDRILLDHVHLVIGDGDKVGLVGRNGAGKSTLLKILAGEQNADEGSVSRPSESTLSFLHQEMFLPKGRSVLEETLTAFEEVKRLEARIAQINQEITERTDYESDSYMNLLQELSDATERFNLLGGQNAEAEAEKVLTGLGFKREEFERATETFSGGWQMRIELAKMLLQRPDYLFLDEPTNHLDIESIIWLEGYLQTLEGAVIVISHDKQFLDNVTRRTVEIEMGKVFDYKASYSNYVQLRMERREKLEAAYRNQQKVIAEKERTINRFMAKATKTKQAQSMQKQLEKLDRIELEESDTATMNLRFPPAPRSGQVVCQAKQLTKKYSDKLVLKDIDLKIDRQDRVAFVGQNGQGKTTLAKILVGSLDKSAGEVDLGHNVSIGYYAQNQADTLHPKLTLLETLERVSPPELRTQLRSILGAFMFSGEDVDKKVSVLSGGERARLALAALLLNPFNLLVLDEPTNHLDMRSKEVLKNALQEYDGTLLVVSHDRDFLRGLTNRTVEFRDRKIHEYIGDVDAFLEKRQLDNMREVELRHPKSQGVPEEAPIAVERKPEISREERKRLQRNLQNAEKAINRLEEKMEKAQIRMAETDFYEQPESAALIEQYKAWESEMEVAMEQWEKAQAEWDEKMGE